MATLYSNSRHSRKTAIIIPQSRDASIEWFRHIEYRPKPSLVVNQSSWRFYLLYCCQNYYSLWLSKLLYSETWCELSTPDTSKTSNMPLEPTLWLVVSAVKKDSRGRKTSSAPDSDFLAAQHINVLQRSQIQFLVSNGGATHNSDRVQFLSLLVICEGTDRDLPPPWHNNPTHYIKWWPLVIGSKFTSHIGLLQHCCRMRYSTNLQRL